MDDDTRAEVSSGNVFHDLGLADAAEKKAKVRLAIAINEALAERARPRSRVPAGRAGRRAP